MICKAYVDADREDIEMEDKKNWNKDELKALGSEDLESVAGGFKMEQLTEEERNHLRLFREEYNWMKQRYSEGNCTEAQFYQSKLKLQKYEHSLKKKYG